MHFFQVKRIENIISLFFFSGKKKFDWDENESVQVVLEVDGTEVSDQDYFSCLPKDTTLMLLRSDQQWAKHDRSDMCKLLLKWKLHILPIRCTGK